MGQGPCPSPVPADPDGNPRQPTRPVHAVGRMKMDDKIEFFGGQAPRKLEISQKGPLGPLFIVKNSIR